jgi:hypothetical protein
MMRVPAKYAKLAKRVEELEALVCPPRQRKMLRIIVADGVDENAAKARAVEEHLGLYPQDPNGVEDYDWIVPNHHQPAALVSASSLQSAGVRRSPQEGRRQSNR